MRRATTPTHTFELGTDATRFAKILVTYKQRGTTKLELTEDDVTVEGQTIIYKLTQEEANEFTEGVNVEIQVRVKTTDGDVFATDIITMPVEAVLNDEVL